MVTQLDTVTGVTAAGSGRSSVLDSALVGDIYGALGTVRQHDVALHPVVERAQDGQVGTARLPAAGVLAVGRDGRHQLAFGH